MNVLARYTSSRQPSIAARRGIWIALVFCVAPALTSLAVPEPDNIFYGTVTMGGQQLTAAGSRVVELIRVGDNEVLDSYTMGSNAAAGDRYVLRARYDHASPAGEAKPGNAVRNGESVTFEVDGTPVDTTVDITQRGEIRELHLTAEASCDFAPASPQTMDEGESMTFSVTPGVTLTSYVWRIDGVEVGTDAATFIYTPGPDTVVPPDQSTQQQLTVEVKDGAEVVCSNTWQLTVRDVPVVEVPVFSPPDGTPIPPEGLDVTITCATPDCAIHFQTDGADPNETSTEYAGALHLTTTTTIRVRAYKDGMAPSAVVEATYSKAASQFFHAADGNTNSRISPTEMQDYIFVPVAISKEPGNSGDYHYDAQGNIAFGPAPERGDTSRTGDVVARSLPPWYRAGTTVTVDLGLDVLTDYPTASTLIVYDVLPFEPASGEEPTAISDNGEYRVMAIDPDELATPVPVVLWQFATPEEIAGAGDSLGYDLPIPADATGDLVWPTGTPESGTAGYARFSAGLNLFTESIAGETVLPEIVAHAADTNGNLQISPTEMQNYIFIPVAISKEPGNDGWYHYDAQGNIQFGQPGRGTVREPSSATREGEPVVRTLPSSYTPGDPVHVDLQFGVLAKYANGGTCIVYDVLPFTPEVGQEPTSISDGGEYRFMSVDPDEEVGAVPAIVWQFATPAEIAGAGDTLSYDLPTPTDGGALTWPAGPVHQWQSGYSRVSAGLSLVTEPIAGDTAVAPPVALPDLHLVLSYRGTMEEGESQTLAPQLQNLGDGDAADITVVFRVNDEVLHTWVVPELAAHTSVVLDDPSYSWSPTGGLYTIKVVADPDDTIQEEDETNNDDGGQVRVTPAAGSWQLPIQMTGAQLAEVVLGMALAGSDDFDPGLDWKSPPAAQGTGYAAFASPTDDLARDFRAIDGEAEWTLVVEAGDDPVTLSWDTADVPGGGLYLVEVDANGDAVQGGVLVLMDVDNTVTIPADTATTLAIRLPGVLMFELTLTDGWNLVSVPIGPVDPAVATVFQGLNTGPVWNWVNGVYVMATEVTPGHGYWVFYLAPEEGGSTTIEVLGLPAESTLRNLAQRWNIVGPIGVPPYGPLALPLVTDPVDSLLEPIWGWNGTVYVGEADALQMGHGYWDYATEACTVKLGE